MATKKKQGVEAAYNNLSQIGKTKKEKEKRDIDFDMFADMFTKEDVENINKQAEEAEKQGMEYIEVSRLIPSKLNKWSMRREDSFKAIVKHMKEHGFEEAFVIIGEKRPDGNVNIISGERRTTIAKEVGIKKVPITYKEFESDKDRLDFINLANLTRRNTVSSIIHNYKLYSEMYDNGEIPKEEMEAFSRKSEYVANKLGVSPATIKNHVFLLNYDEKLWDLIDDKVVARSTLYSLHRDNEANKFKNYKEIINELVQNEDVYDLDLPLDARQKIAKEIFAKLEKKRSGKEKKLIVAKEIPKINKNIASLMDKLECPKTAKDKQETISAIDELISNLNKIKNQI